MTASLPSVPILRFREWQPPAPPSEKGARSPGAGPGRGPERTGVPQARAPPAAPRPHSRLHRGAARALPAPPPRAAVAQPATCDAFRVRHRAAATRPHTRHGPRRAPAAGQLRGGGDGGATASPRGHAAALRWGGGREPSVGRAIRPRLIFGEPACSPSTWLVLACRALRVPKSQ